MQRMLCFSLDKKRVAFIAIVFALIVVLTGCSSLTRSDGIPFWKFWVPSDGASVVEAPPLETPSVVDTTSEKKLATGELPEPPRTPTIEATALQNVYFDFDRSTLMPASKDILKKNAQWLSENPNVAVQIQGHCDYRGTIEYNYGLGQRRADNVRNYLIKQGLDQSKLHTISYGEEYPVDPGRTEEACAKNRRAEFRVYKD